MEFAVQESSDRHRWSTIRHLRTLRDCYLELVGFQESFPVKSNPETFEWELKDGSSVYYYRILKRGAVLKKEGGPEARLRRK